MNSTVWWESKQLWGALIIFVATLAQAKWGFVIDPLTQGYIVSAIIVILRLVTKGPVTATKPPNPEKEAKVYAAQTVVTAEKVETAVVNAAENVEEIKKQ
jgi:predicted membrane chloride channel (bestrophin family)